MAKHLKDGECVDDDEWQCPLSWMAVVPRAALPPPPLMHTAHACNDPTPKFGDCFKSLCCADKGFGCFKKDGFQYAQCRPEASKCADEGDWLCPSSWIVAASHTSKLMPKPSPHSTAAAPKSSPANAAPPTSSAPPPPSVLVCTTPSEDFGACYDSWCCKHGPGFGCFKKVGKVLTGLLAVDVLEMLVLSHMLIGDAGPAGQKPPHARVEAHHSRATAGVCPVPPNGTARRGRRVRRQ